jgi:hypothetical protein
MRPILAQLEGDNEDQECATIRVEISVNEVDQSQLSGTSNINDIGGVRFQEPFALDEYD